MTNFSEAIKQVQSISKKPIFYRLYYNAEGDIICYSMEDLDFKYIEITAEEFAISNMDVFVKDDEIHKKQLSSIGKLVPINGGSADVSIIAGEPKWRMKTYD